MTPEQERLVVAHMHIVPAIAKQLIKRFSLPHWIELEEMVSCGYVGLCNAALRFDPTRAEFGTYASFKVRGAIIDEFLRRQAPIHESIDKGQTLLTNSCNRYQNGAGHPALSNEGELVNYRTNEPPDPSPSVEDILIEEGEQRRKCRHLAFASKSVGDIEFRAVSKKHMKGETLREIGAAEGRSASWAHYRVHCGERQLREALLEPVPTDP